MGDSTLDSELFILFNNWGQPVVEKGHVPKGGFTGSAHHNVSVAAYSVGTVCAVPCTGATGKAGWAQMIYLQVGTQNADSVLAVKDIVVPDSATTWYQITNDPDSCVALPTAVGAVALGAMTNAYYGWFWCGGNCPEQYVSGLGGNYETEGNVAAGHITCHDLAADAIGLGPYATTEGYFGFALAADAA
jgi:hypothetical protein